MDNLSSAGNTEAVSDNNKNDKSVEANRWSSGAMFVLAAAGAAIGLNNFWQFPYLVGQHGGGLFILTYLVCLALVAWPILVSEIAVGRLGRGSPIQAVRKLVNSTNSDPNWYVLGSIKTFTGVFILSYLSVIAGWCMAYAVRAASGMFDGLTSAGMNSLFSDFVHDPEKQAFWHTLFIITTLVVAARGLKGGFEPVVRRVMPLLLLVLLLLLAYSASLGSFGNSLLAVFAPEPETWGIKSVLVALGHAFFSLGLGYGALLMYSAYLPDKASVARVSLGVIGLDTTVALLASVVVFALLLGGGQESLTGPSLVFQAIPLALDVLPYGRAVLVAFYLVLVLAAWLTAIALVEPVMTWLIESHAMSRFRAAIWTGFGVWLFGLVCILSFEYWAFEFEYFGIKKYLGLFDSLQIFTSNFLLPLAGMLVALFAGWALNDSLDADALGLRPLWLYKTWLWLARLVAPLLLIVVAISVPKLFL